MFNFRFPLLYDADEGTTGGSAAVEASESTQQAPDYNKLLEGVDLDELMKTESLAKKVQSIADSRVSQALATAKSKWEKEQLEAQDEATKLSKMNEAEKAKYQFEKDKAAFEAEKARFQHEQLQVETAKQLIASGLPDLSPYVTGKNAEETKQNITQIATILGEWKSNALKAATAGRTPEDVRNAGKQITKEDIKKMSAQEINDAYEKGLIDLKNLK